MAYSNTIPANVIPCLRIGAIAAQADAAAELTKRADKAFTERHRREELCPIVDSWKRYGALLELIGLPGDEIPETVEMDPAADHLLAATEALERFEQDHPRECTAEIAAFRREVGLWSAPG